MIDEKVVPIAECEAQRIKLLYGKNPVTQILGLVNVGIFVALFDNNAHSIRIWGLAMAGLFALRMIIQRRFQSKYMKQVRILNTSTHEFVFAAGGVCIAMAWGFAGVFLVGDSTVDQAFFGFLLAGTTAAAAVAYCTSIMTAQAFVLSAIIPFAVRLAFGNGAYCQTMSTLLILYVVSLSFSLFRLNRYAAESIRFRFEKEQLKRKLSETEAQIVHSAKMAALGQMAGGIAHEINNPLAIIRGYGGQLKTMSLAGEMNQDLVNQILDKIEGTTVRLAKIVSGMRYFARDQKDNEPMESVPVRKIISETMDFCQNRFRSHGVALTVDPISFPLTIRCRRIQISQVLLNLLNNAFDATQGQPDAAVHIGIREEDNFVLLTIVDNGSGIAPEIRDQIMLPFFTTKDVGKGTGLGLSIAHGIAQAHGGDLRIDLTSHDTRFIFSIPLSSNETGEIQSDTLAAS